MMSNSLSNLPPMASASFDRVSSTMSSLSPDRRASSVAGDDAVASMAASMRRGSIMPTSFSKELTLSLGRRCFPNRFLSCCAVIVVGPSLFVAYQSCASRRLFDKYNGPARSMLQNGTDDKSITSKDIRSTSYPTHPPSPTQLLSPETCTSRPADLSSSSSAPPQPKSSLQISSSTCTREEATTRPGMFPG